VVNERNDDAVSPVIGVMLMIVVTIIIAAAVSVFSTAFVSDTDTAPGAQVGYVGVMAGQSGGLGEIGLVFENKGGDALLLSDVELHLRSTLSGGDEVSISYTDAPSSTYIGIIEPNEARLSSSLSKTRMKKIGAGTSNPVEAARVKAGDRFVIYADRYIDDGTSTYGRIAYVADRDTPGMPYTSGEFEVSSRTTYTLSDTNTGAVISSGTLVGSVL